MPVIQSVLLAAGVILGVAAVVVLLLAGLIFGLVAVVETRGLNWAGWGVIAIAIAVLLMRLGG
jgi:hypothetical protein